MLFHCVYYTHNISTIGKTPESGGAARPKVKKNLSDTLIFALNR
jgi:hypothetical protein